MISKEHVMNMQSGGEFQWIDSLTSVFNYSSEFID